jgi:hypothetical protein
MVNKRKMAKETKRRRLAEREGGEIEKSTATGRKYNFAESYGSASSGSCHRSHHITQVKPLHGCITVDC